MISVAGQLVSAEASVGIAPVAAPGLPEVSVSNPRFEGSTLLHDLVVESLANTVRPIVNAQSQSTDVGVDVSLTIGADESFSGSLAVDLSVADYQNPQVGSTHPAALVALIDAAGLVGDADWQRRLPFRILRP